MRYYFRIFRIKSSKARLVKVAFVALVLAWLGCVVAVFYKFAPLAFGVVPLAADDVRGLKWKDSWDLIIHKQ